WHALAPPYLDLFAWREARGPRPSDEGKLIFRPLMLANPIEEGDWPGLIAGDIAAEWKWDGVRVQIAANGGDARIFSRSGDDISAGFPEIVSAYRQSRAVLDGELLVVRSAEPDPFTDLQQRLNRKSVSPRMMKESPAFVRLYDLLFEGSEDLRELAY